MTSIAFAARRASSLGPRPNKTSGKRLANCGSNETDLANLLDSVPNCSLSQNETSLKALYCINLANKRSLASNLAMSSSSSTSPDGSSLAVFKSRSVAAITKNSVVSSRSQVEPWFFMYCKKSSVTM